jgi:AraC-like DNA-binding protein
MQKDIIEVIYITVILLGLVISVLFTYYNFKDGRYGKLASLMLFLSNYGLFSASIAATGYMVYIPHMFRTGLLVLFLIPPLTYLAIRAKATQNPLIKKDLVHFIPAALYLINFYPSLTASYEEKIKLISLQSISIYDEGIFFSHYGIITMNTVLLLFYIIKIYVTIWKPVPGPIHPIVKGIAFMFIGFLLIQLFVPLLIMLGEFNGLKRDSLNLIYFLFIIFFYGSFFYRPHLIYGESFASGSASKVDGTNVYISKTTSTGESRFPSIAASDIPGKDFQNRVKVEDFQKIETYLMQTKDFLRRDFSLELITINTGLSKHEIRGAIRLVDKCSIPEYINKKRILYLLEEINKKPVWRTYDTTVLAQKLGYKSVNTFYMAFKSLLGEPPKNYINRRFLSTSPF